MNTNSQLVLNDDDGSSLDFPDFSSEGAVNPACGASINIENSTDVIIGPVTQFNGPVTIYPNQDGTTLNGIKNLPNYDAKLVKSESTASDSPQNNHNDSLIAKLRETSTRFKCLGVVFFVLIVIAILIGVVFWTKGPPERGEKHPDPGGPKGPSFDPPDRTPLGKHYLISRKGWGAKPPHAVVPAQTPVSFVIISHTVTPVCTTFLDCSNRVKNIQNFHLFSSGLNDIGHNFLIAGDGNVYEGRGWGVRNMHSANSLAIGFIGDYMTSELSESMIEDCQDLIEMGVRMKKVAEDYRLVGHNQTFNTLSPGVNVYKVIKTWAHFDPGQYFNLR